MEDRTGMPRDVPLQVRQVRQALTQEFAGLLDLTDLPALPEAQREQIFLSRALAAKAVALVADCTAAEAAEAVTDGADDHGIDAVLASPATAEIWLIQTKWSNKGAARPDGTAVRKLLHGLERLVDNQYARFNAKFQRLAGQVNSVLNGYTPRIHLVLAALGEGGPTHEGQELLDGAVAEYNAFGELLDLRVLGFADFYTAARRDTRPAPVSVTATLTQGWYTNTIPYRTFVGTVAADQPATWYAEHRERLFAQNVRYSLGLTSVNAGMVDTLLGSPQDFWYFNNGITILCDSIRTRFSNLRQPTNHSANLELINARVVNGAQTVASLHYAYTRDPEAVQDAAVSVRVICLDDAPSDLAQRITQATNKQNGVEERDFAALDPQQELIREDFSLSLGKSYVLKRGEQEPAPAAGCSVVEAALALACSYPDASMAARTRQDLDALWRQGSDGLYSRLFGNRPSALQIWRSVRLMRAVRDELAALTENLEGRDRVVAEQADLLIIHIAFQLIGTDAIDDPGDDWEDRLEPTAKLTAIILAGLRDQLNAPYGRYRIVNRTLRNEESCRRLVADVLLSMGQVADQRPTAPQRPVRRRRRPNSVPVLVEHRRIEDGTQLIYRPANDAERAALQDWLSDAPERCLASWVNDGRKPLIWAEDGRPYSPTALVMRMWEEAGWAERPLAVQGTARWYLPGEGTLADLAEEILTDTDATGDGSGAE
ncbi:AIPR family protein [Streptomyces sp. MBT60]|uniref:AIPR family protein n=1 Tax=Streptomyces sp. MBT60 TaxID=2800409 RepID=UPI00190E2B2C|nr:AIPR family protein [Streptomyces sp. MBT60]MBK3544830.1 AIPR family protein [Streptomyces sp. MBT60]